jgi:hypothetical protein
MHPQIALAMAKANQDEFLRRAARPSSIGRPPRSNPIDFVRPALSAVMRRALGGHRPVGKVAGAET